MNLYEYAKNKVVSWICSGETVNLKILKSDWLKAFWPISQEEQDFSQTQDLYRNTGNNINFHYRTNSLKINDQIFI